MRLRMEAIKSTALLRSYSTSPMVLALAIVLDLALPLYGVGNCVWLGCKLYPGCQGAWGRWRGFRGSTGVNGPNVRLRMEAIKSTALLRSYSTSPMVLALAIVLDLALPLYGVSNCVWLGCKLYPGCQDAWGRWRG